LCELAVVQVFAYNLPATQNVTSNCDENQKNEKTIYSIYFLYSKPWCTDYWFKPLLIAKTLAVILDRLKMNDDNKYIFASERLGFRNWELTDIEKMHQINSDEKVMEFFPSIPTEQHTAEFVERMKNQFANKNFCYFAVDKLYDNEFIGFIGLSEQTYKAAFTPCVDIGWRIKRSEWNKGFASEGAKKCLDYALNDLKLENVYSIAPKVNIKSVHIMTKIGLKKQYEFEHPFLTNNDRLKTCVLYKNEKKIKTTANTRFGNSLADV
jgi:RimJ/RimL family protein N-acetyltransferase